ncbi:MAG: hypothetical protein AB7L13_08315 [Acidimicrobiia bacterium]
MTPEEAGNHQRLLAIADAMGIESVDTSPPDDRFVETNGLRMHVRLPE